MSDKIINYNPFAYDTDYYMYTEKEEAEKNKFISYATKKGAKYNKPAETVFEIDDKKDLVVFRDNIEAPTPELKSIIGLGCGE